MPTIGRFSRTAPVEPRTRGAEGEDAAVTRDEPVAAAVGGRGHADDRLVQLHAAHRAEELGGAEGEHAAVTCDGPVAGRGVVVGDPDDRRVQGLAEHRAARGRAPGTRTRPRRRATTRSRGWTHRLRGSAETNESVPTSPSAGWDVAEPPTKMSLPSATVAEAIDWTCATRAVAEHLGEDGPEAAEARVGVAVGGETEQGAERRNEGKVRGERDVAERATRPEPSSTRSEMNVSLPVDDRAPPKPNVVSRVPFGLYRTVRGSRHGPHRRR